MTARRILSIVFASMFALAVAACDDDDDENPPIDSGGGGPDTAVPGPDAAGGGPDAAGAGAAPAISMVQWSTPAGCVAGMPSSYMIVTTASDPDTAGPMLTYSGSASGCTGSINSATAAISCPNVMPYPGSVTVTDPEGNSDTQSFTIGVCSSGSAP